MLTIYKIKKKIFLVKNIKYLMIKKIKIRSKITFKMWASSLKKKITIKIIFADKIIPGTKKKC